MDLRRKKKILAGAKSPSTEAMKRTYKRAYLNGGTTVDFSANVDNIRELSIDLGNVDVLSDATYVFVPSSYGEAKVFGQGDDTADFTCTRATVAKRVNELDRVEDTQHNLLVQSETFNTTWTKTLVTITDNAAVAPNGATTADRFVSAGGNTPLISQAIAGLSIGATYNFSIHVKTDGTSQLAHAISVVGIAAVTTFTPTDNWVRISHSFVATATTHTVRMYYNSTSAPATSFYIWGAQFTLGTTIRPYLSKVTALTAMPKFDYSRSLTEPQWLVEPQRTNICLQSQTFNGTGWTETGISTTATNYESTLTLAPDGTRTADFLNELLGGTFHYTAQTIVVVANTPYTFSCYLKRNQRQYASIGITSNAIDYSSIFDLTGAGATSNTSAGTVARIKALADGWYRCSVSMTTTATITGTSVFIQILNGGTLSNGSYAGVVGWGHFAWGAQLEVSAYPSTYIPTVAASAQRNSDTAFADLLTNGLFNQNNFTIFFEGWLYANATANPVLCLGLSDTTAFTRANDVGFFDGMKATRCSAAVVTSDTVNMTPGASGVPFKLAIQRNGTAVKYFRNGAQIWTTQTVAVVNYRYLVVNNGSTSNAGSAYGLSKIALFDRTLSDAECNTITTL